MSTVPHSLPAPSTGLPTRLAACAGVCAWTLLATLAATALLALFVLVTESHTGIPLLESMAQPLNLTRLVVLTGCLTLWGYILRNAPRTGDLATAVEGASTQTRLRQRRMAPTPGRG